MIQSIKAKLVGNTLRARFLRGSAWLAMGNIAERILAFLSKIVLARLLFPEDLGVVVLIASITGLFECLTEVGVKQCLIQHENGGDADFLNMVWWFSALRGCVLFLTAWMLAPWVCRFYFEGQEQVLARYDWPTLVMIVRVAFLNMLFYGLVSPRAHLMEKQFRFARVVGYTQSAAIIGTLAAIVLAFSLRNAWAVVIAFVCQGFLRMAMSYVFCPYLPKLNFHGHSLIEIVRFARGMWGAPFFAYIAYNIDMLVGGKVLGAEAIGLYSFAVGLALVPRDFFTRIINPILLPAFAEKKHDMGKLKKTIGQLSGNLILISVPVIIMSFLFHRIILTFLYGQRFAEVSPVYAVFTVNVMIVILSMIFVNLFIAVGRPEINRNIAFARALVLVCLTVPVAKTFGMMGMAIMLTIVNLIVNLLFYVQAKRITSLRITDMLPDWTIRS